MNKRHFIWIGAGIVVAAAAGFGGWIFTRPSGAAVAAAPPIAQQETAAMLAALQPPKRQRPVIAIIGINDATETLDYVMATGILRRADVADVLMVATGPGHVKLYPALTVEPDTTVTEFDASHPDGADYIIVPAMKRDDDPTALQWIKAQAAKGAIVIGVCAGAKVVAAAGLLDNKRATTHWFYLKELLEKHPSIRYVPNRRIVIDQRVVTTTGITAAMPLSLALIEAIAGRDTAESMARDLGIDHWDARHASDEFQFTRSFALTVMGNVMAFWNREKVGVELQPGVDEVSFALAADAWSRTYRSRAVTLAESSAAVRTRNGIRIVPDKVSKDSSQEALVETFAERPPAQALNATLSSIESRYGAGTRYVVGMQLEYPQQAATR